MWVSHTCLKPVCWCCRTSGWFQNWAVRLDYSWRLQFATMFVLCDIAATKRASFFCFLTLTLDKLKHLLVFRCEILFKLDDWIQMWSHVWGNHSWSDRFTETHSAEGVFWLNILNICKNTSTVLMIVVAAAVDSFRSMRRPPWRWRTLVSGCVTTPAVAPTTCTESTETWPPLEPSLSAVSTHTHIQRPCETAAGGGPLRVWFWWIFQVLLRLERARQIWF